MNFRMKTAITFLFGLALCFPRFALADPVDAECGTDAYSIIGAIPKTGTVKAVALYACGSNASTDTLPDWWARVWDTAQQHSIPRFYKDNSLGQYIMVSTPYGRDAGHCFKASIPFCVATAFCGLSDYAFFDSIMRQADAAINFANFDGNNDDTVDAFFFVVVNHGGSSGLAGGFGWTTNDISANGRSVIIASNRSTRNRIASEPRAVYVCSHEWGHMLGAPDLYSDIFGGWGLGSFSVMGNGFPGLRTFPFDPWDRIRFGWVTPTTVTAPLYGQSIPDYLTTGTVYKLPIGTNEYFLVTNHRGIQLSQNPAAFWEEQMPGNGGVLAWHIDETSRSNKKTIDVELAHGLYNFINYLPDTQNPNDSTGQDSLDIKGTKPDGSDFGYTYPSLASATCWWNSQTKNTFDGLSNPSSDGHGDQIINGKRAQNVPSHLAVRKIQAGNFSSATADLLVNNWYGHITQNTTWGPGVYAITGDITVDSGKTLTIQPGTTIYFQKNEDNQASGVSTGKSELIVANGGNLIAIGTPSSPIKFLSSSSNPFFDEWYGIRVYGSAKLKNCWIKNAYAGIDYQNTAYDTVRACVFEKNVYFGLQARNNNVYIVADTFKNNGMGVCFDPASAVVESCYFKDNSIGIYTLRSFGRIAHNKIIGTCYNSDVGFQAEGYVSGATQFLTFENNLDSGQFYTAAVIANARVKIKDSRVRIVKQTCFPVPADPPLNIGILGLGTDAASIRHTFIKSTGYTSNAPPTVEIDATPTLDLGQAGADSGKNSITRGTGGKAVLNYSGSSVYARQNYWGTSTPDSATLFSGSVLFTPYLTTEPPPPSAPRIAVEEKGEGILPLRLVLGQNYPNPFNPTTTISFSLSQPEKVKLKIYNLLGQEVLTLLDGEKPAGTHQIIWDGRDENGVTVASGIYFYKLEAGNFKEVKRMVFLK